MTTTKEELKQLAQRALDKSNGGAKWLTIDTKGQVYVYRFRPILRDTEWDVSDYSNEFWGVGYTTPPVNFRNELYEISKILNNEL